MKDRGRIVSGTYNHGGPPYDAARISSSGRHVEVRNVNTGRWEGAWSACADIDELILEDNRNVTAVLSDGSRKYATCLSVD